MRRQFVALFVLFGVVVAACGSNEAAVTTTVRVKPEVTVTYNGADCVHDGPTSMTEGNVSITFLNATDAEVWLGWWQLNDDVEYDHFANQNNPTQGLPTGMIAKQVFWAEAPSGEKEQTGGLLAGTHALACVLHVGTGMSSRVTETMDFASVEVTS